MINELISIIVPVYNAESFINNCVQSILKQTYKEIELILVDDGSTDNSLNVCSRLASSDSRIVLLHQDNSGPAKARNLGLNKAKGKWILFVDSDDSIAANMCEVMLNTCHQHNADMCLCNLVNIEQEKKEYRIPLKGNNRSFSNAKEIEYLKKMLLTNNSETGDILTNLLGPVCKLMLKSVIGNNRFPESIKLGEDTSFIFTIISDFSRIIYINDCLYFRTVMPTSLVHSVNPEKNKYIRDFTIFIKEQINDDTNYQDELIIFMYNNLLKVINNNTTPDFNVCIKDRCMLINDFIEGIGFKPSVFSMLKTKLNIRSKIKLLISNFGKNTLSLKIYMSLRR